MSDDVVVRPARVEDADQLGLAHTRSWQVAYRGLVPDGFLDSMDPVVRANRWRSNLESSAPGTETLVAEVDGQVVGFTSHGPSRDEGDDPSVGELWGLYLDPSTWGLGLGRTLIEHSLAALADSGYSEVILWVLRGNERAIRFYEAAGFRADGGTKVDDDIAPFALHELRYRRSL